MNVYRFGSSHIAWILRPDGDAASSFFGDRTGVPIVEGWSPLGVEFVPIQMHPSGPYPHFNVIDHVPVLSRAAVDDFAGLLSGHVQTLPLRNVALELLALSVPFVDGAIDIDASDVERFEGGRIMRFRTFVFHGEVVAGHPMFRISEFPSQVFVNQDFVAWAMETTHAGLRATLVWSDDDGGPPSLPLAPEPGRTLSAEELLSLEASVLDNYLWDIACTAAGDVAAMSTAMRAFYVTRLFEWEVSNGGLHQYFFNNPAPEMIEAVAEGYELFGVPKDAAVIRELVAPFAARESEWRASLRDGTIETFFDSYPESQLDQFEDRVGFHDIERLNYVRLHPESFLG